VTQSLAAFNVSGRPEIMAVSFVNNPFVVRLSEACSVRETVVWRPRSCPEGAGRPRVRSGPSPCASSPSRAGHR
jgi:hypothetical protein